MNEIMVRRVVRSVLLESDNGLSEADKKILSSARITYLNILRGLPSGADKEMLMYASIAYALLDFDSFVKRMAVSYSKSARVAAGVESGERWSAEIDADKALKYYDTIKRIVTQNLGDSPRGEEIYKLASRSISRGGRRAQSPVVFPPVTDQERRIFMEMSGRSSSGSSQVPQENPTEKPGSDVIVPSDFELPEEKTDTKMGTVPLHKQDGDTETSTRDIFLESVSQYIDQVIQRRGAGVDEEKLKSLGIDSIAIVFFISEDGSVKIHDIEIKPPMNQISKNARTFTDSLLSAFPKKVHSLPGNESWVDRIPYKVAINWAIN